MDSNHWPPAFPTVLFPLSYILTATVRYFRCPEQRLHLQLFIHGCKNMYCNSAMKLATLRGNDPLWLSAWQADDHTMQSQEPLIGAGEETRTLDIWLGRTALYHWATPAINNICVLESNQLMSIWMPTPLSCLGLLTRYHYANTIWRAWQDSNLRPCA
jgi:hypothetical protein